MRKVITILVIVCMSLSAVSIHAAQSTFDTDAEGWSMMFLTTFGNPPTGMAGSWFWWESTMGNPGGCIKLREKAGYSEIFKAPEEYLGDKSSAFGTNLTFDLWTYRGTSTEEMFIALVGNDTTLYYKSSVIGGSWNQYGIPLLGSGWKKNSPSGPDATDADMLNVLGNVLALYIWGDFTFFADEYSRLDNVFMAEAPVVIAVEIDIKPQSCPNPLNLKSKGVLPVAVLGTEDFDVSTIDPATIGLSREGVVDEDDRPIIVSPLRWAYEDVATPFEGELCDCHTEGPDGYLDLTLKFDVPELVAKLKLDEVAGETIPLTLTGSLKEEFGGAPIRGEDCISVLKEKGPQKP